MAIVALWYVVAVLVHILDLGTREYRFICQTLSNVGGAGPRDYAHMHTLYRGHCMTFQANYEIQRLMYTWAWKLDHQNQRKDWDRLHHHHHCKYSRHRCVILAHVIWALAREWELSIRISQTVTWALTSEWSLVRDTTVFSMCVLHTKVAACVWITVESRNYAPLV